MTTTRITQNMIADRSVAAMQLAAQRLARAQEQLSTGRVLNRPSDSPTGTAGAMRLRSSLVATDQHLRNAEDGAARLAVADTHLGTITDQVRKARELGLQGASTGASSPASRAALATEVEQLRAGLVDAANATYLGRPVFGGITAGSRAYDDDGAFVGEAGAITRRVGDGVKVRVDVSGPEALGPGGGASGSVFEELDALATALRSGDDAGVQAGLSALASRLDRVGAVRAQVGATAARLETATTALGGARADLAASLSDVEEIDLPAATVELSLRRVAYQAALDATARVNQPSLLDFLR